MKKIFLFLIAFGFLFANEKQDILVLSGPAASVSHPFFKIIEDGALNDVAKKIVFREWSSPDELKALVLKNDVDFVAMPTNVAAIFYNKGENIKLMSISVWGIFNIISSDENIKHIEDLKGDELIVPFRADMPDVILQALLKKANIDIKKDIKINYVQTPPNAVQMLVTKKAKHALLMEPITSMALQKANSFPQSVLFPKLYRAIDLQVEWGRLFGSENKIPQAGIAAVGDKNEKLKQRLNEEYAKALLWYKQNPKEAGELSAKYIKAFNAQMVEDSILHINMQSVNIEDAKDELKAFYEILYSYEPKLIGEKMPDDKFYK
ncbi:MAG: ABC transporter substrate-binding protein [Campylobacteraceae bacterium]|nr:ABC transporter substrate-binding protein [Campylobacteraceae bacterium]